MTATVKDGKLTVTIDLVAPRPSQTGKTLVVASTGGFRGTAAAVDGREIAINLTATVRP